MGSGREAGSKCAISLIVFLNWKIADSLPGTVLINKEEAKYRMWHSSFITLSIKAATKESQCNYWAIYVHTHFNHTDQYFSNINAHTNTWALVRMQLFWGGAWHSGFNQAPRCCWWTEDHTLNSKEINCNPQHAGMTSRAPLVFLHCTHGNNPRLRLLI